MKVRLSDPPPADVEVVGNLRVLRYEDQSSRPSVKIWRHKHQRPYTHFYFKTAEQREEYIAKQVEFNKASAVEKEAYKKKRSQMKEEMLQKIKVGTILHYSWGYERCEYFQVVAMKGKWVILQAIKAIPVPGNECQMKPGRNQFCGAPFTKIIVAHGVLMSFGLDPNDISTPFGAATPVSCT